MSPPEAITLKDYLRERLDDIDAKLTAHQDETRKIIDKIYDEFREQRKVLAQCRGRCDSERTQIWSSVDGLKIQQAENSGRIEGLDHAATTNASAGTVLWMKVAALVAMSQVVVAILLHVLKLG